MPRRHRWTALLIACSIVASPTSSPACCPAWRPGQPVRIADQQILVIWDPDTRTEHFIREAKFSARAEGVEGRPEGFGFLVPSPTLPEIAAADGSVFGHLNDRIKPRIEEVTRWRTHYSLLWRLFAPTSLVPTSRAMTDTAPPPMASIAGESRGVIRQLAHHGRHEHRRIEQGLHRSPADGAMRGARASRRNATTSRATGVPPRCTRTPSSATIADSADAGRSTMPSPTSSISISEPAANDSLSRSGLGTTTRPAASMVVFMPKWYQVW